MSKFGIGQPVRRVEDQRLITGQGRYTDDINLPGQAYGYVLRSPTAHARIARLDTAAAKAAPGVLLVITGGRARRRRMPCFIPITNRDGTERADPPHPILCTDEVNHVGDHVAFVVAETRAQAKDAAELIEVEYERLPAVADTAGALAPARPQVHPEAPGNLAFDWHYGDEAAGAGGVRQGRAGGQARADQQPGGLQRDGAARLRRRVGRRRRQAHAADRHPGRLGPSRHRWPPIWASSPSRCA